MTQTILLRAIDPTRNLARQYTISLARDMFGRWVVDYRWGRVGTAGQGRRASFADDVAAQVFIGQLLKRRAGATRRIGVPYRQVS
jgi:predicted DNA-binding WGR domain protein